MNKQTLFVTLTTAALMCGCQSSKVKISGRFVGGDAKNIYLEQVLPLTQSVVDSAALAPDGSYRMELTGVAKTPSLYNVIYDGERIPLLLAGGVDALSRAPLLYSDAMVRWFAGMMSLRTAGQKLRHFLFRIHPHRLDADHKIRGLSDDFHR